MSEDASNPTPISTAPAVRWCPTCRSPFRSDFARCPIDGTAIIETETDLLLGQTFGQHYVIDALIGEGAMARVYRAHHSLLPHKHFAVKVMIGDLTSTLEMRLRFAAEANAASQLEHPNVVSVVDFGKTDGGLMYLVMELFDGDSLASLILEEAPLAPSRALALARQICMGLGHAHERGLVHRDLKPDNVIVIKGNPEHARIVDFGLAIPIDEERSARLTHVGLMVGTPVYASPEQTHNELVDHRADLFALGVTLYEMLAGVTPFSGGLAQLIQHNASDVFVPIAARSEARVPSEVESIVRRLMRRDPANRFANAREVIDAIDAASSAMTQNAGVAMSLVALPVNRMRRALWIAVSAVIAIALVATFVVWTWPHEAPAVTVAVDPAPATAVPVAPIPPPPVATLAAAPSVTIVELPAAATVENRAPVTRKITPRTRPAKPVVVASTALEPEVHTVVPGSGSESRPLHLGPGSGSESRPLHLGPVPAPEVAPTFKPTLPPVVTTPPPPSPLVPVLTTARAVITALTVRGPLSDADVRRAIERGLPAMRTCYRNVARAAKRSPAATVRLSLSFDDSRRALVTSAIAAGWPELAACVRTTADDLRVQVAPDVGTADVVVEVAFQPVSP